MKNGPCPCGTGQVYDDCCGRFHRGYAEAPTAEALMRSRYSAFAVGRVTYLRETWHPSTRPAQLTLPRGGRWTRLDVCATSRGGVFDTEGTVEFEAAYEIGGQVGVQRENSRFVRENRRWFYLGDVPPAGAAAGRDSA
jgi:SEC-C motif-containing protein